MSACNYTQPINENECIGDSLDTINENFANLDDALCNVVLNPLIFANTDTIDLIKSGNNVSGSVKDGSITTQKIGTNAVSYSRLFGNTGSSESVQPRLAKAWVAFNGTTATPLISLAFNVDGVSKTGTGQYRVSFTDPFLDTRYVPQITINDGFLNGGSVIQGSVAGLNTDYIDIQVQSQVIGVDGYDTAVYLTIFAS